MNFKKLGNTNLNVSTICLGTMTYGEQNSSNDGFQPFMTSVIIGATTMQQLKTDIESVNVNLPEEIIKEINEVQKIYPNPCP